ncbi:ttv [Symbiodinium necroappetens]|uniref:Ttv protein n=1 Tax=Symbiodinium necroappetens TaxID=1628268 RepID=A0A812Z770_9DINO|nr:ttv [Symbiodinium necroappetens]
MHETPSGPRVLNSRLEFLLLAILLVKTPRDMQLLFCAAHVVLAWRCERTFHVLSPESAEAHSPELAGCRLLEYAEALRRGLASSPCASDLTEASVIVIPGYTFHNCHWPHYGGNCESEGTISRPGRECYDEQTMRAYRRLIDAREFARKSVAIMDGSGRVQSAWLPDLSFYNHPRVFILRLGAPVWFHRPGIDVSLPPGPLSRCAGQAAMHAMRESLDEKRYFATFKGKLRHNQVRATLAHLHHNDLDVIIVDRLDDSYDYDQLLYSSIFSLILEGDMLQTFHFAEAVCSGGIPVLISSKWVPPLQELLPFESYGLRFRDDEIPSLMVKLRALDALSRLELRQRAMDACISRFRTLEVQADSVAQQLSLTSFRPTAPSKQSASAADSLGVGRCLAAASSPTLFYIMSVTETEAFAPKLQGCLLSNLAGSLHHAFLSLRKRSSNCMAMQLEHAHIVLVPGYSVLPDVTRPLSFPGRSCAPSQIYEGYRQLRLHAHLDGKLLVLSDMGDKGLPQDTSFSRLLLGARRSTFQYGIDVSMPAEPTPRCSGEAASMSFMEPLEHKRFLVSFKGRWEPPWEKQVAALHDNNNVVIVDDANAEYDAEFLLWNSVFILVFATANYRNSRFNEAVCSGGIPVAMADASWVPPFDGFIRFSSYGVLIEDSNPSNLLPRLRDVLLNTAEVHVLRGNARKVCTRFLQTREVQAAAALEALETPNRAEDDSLSVVLTQTLLDQEQNHLYALFETGALFRAVASRARTLQHLWMTVAPGPFEYVAASGEAVFAVSGQQVYKHLGPLRSVSPDSDWTAVSRGRVQALAIHDGVMLAAGLDGNIYQQDVNAMSIYTDWELLLEGRNFSRISVHAGVLYATSQLHAASSVYSLDLSSPSHGWVKASIRRIPGDVGHLL